MITSLFAAGEYAGVNSELCIVKAVSVPQCFQRRDS